VIIERNVRELKRVDECYWNLWIVYYLYDWMKRKQG